MCDRNRNSVFFYTIFKNVCFIRTTREKFGLLNILGVSTICTGGPRSIEFSEFDSGYLDVVCTVFPGEIRYRSTSDTTSGKGCLRAEPDK